VDPQAFAVFEKRAKAILSLQCSSCHAVRDQGVPSYHKLKQPPLGTVGRRKEFDESIIAPLLKERKLPDTVLFSSGNGSGAEAAADTATAGTTTTTSQTPFSSSSSLSSSLGPLLDHSLKQFQQSRAEFMAGTLNASSFVDLLHTSLLAQPLTKGDASGLPCSSFAAVLHSLRCGHSSFSGNQQQQQQDEGEDPEREATLHAAYLKRFPDCFSLCCKVRHCFNCHIRGFHDGKSCEQYQATIATMDDIVPCPKCGLQLTKGDGETTMSSEVEEG
jgi:hypothetical protein